MKKKKLTEFMLCETRSLFPAIRPSAFSFPFAISSNHTLLSPFFVSFSFFSPLSLSLSLSPLCVHVSLCLSVFLVETSCYSSSHFETTQHWVHISPSTHTRQKIMSLFFSS